MFRKVILSGGVLMLHAAAFGQTTSEVSKSFMDDPLSHPMLPVYLVISLIFIVAVLVAFAGIFMIRAINMLTVQAEKEKAKRMGVAYVPRLSWWNRFSQQMNASVPVEQEKDIELEHSYDGIKELDNHLPPWWKWLFYGTIGWSLVYLVVFHVSDMLPLSEAEYQNEVAFADEQARKHLANQPATETIDENTLEFKNDPLIIGKGKDVFASNPCGSCHRNDGGGNSIGPNLTDEYWIHGGDV